MKSIPLELIHEGKTRRTYRAGKYRLVEATDRLSTHNVVHKSLVPRKGEVLTAMTIYWLQYVLGPAGILHHMVAYGQSIYHYLPGRREDYPDDLHLRAIIVRDLKMIPFEFIFRNYLTGSLWSKFYSKGVPNPYGVALPEGLELMSPLDRVFTPTDKSETDDPVNADEVGRAYPEAVNLARRSFQLIRQRLNEISLEEVDGKFEIGMDEAGVVFLADEAGTPDSSRFCERDRIKLGEDPPWLDKERARKEAERIWGKGPKVPLEFDPMIISGLTDTYLDICGRVAGMSLDEFQRTRLS